MLAICKFVLPAVAETASFIPLGDLPGGDTSSFARAISADGSRVTGYSESAEGQQAFTWTAEELIQPLGFLEQETGVSRGFAVSADGSTVAGFSTTSLGFEAFRGNAGGLESVGDLEGGITNSFAFGISANGNVVVGSGFNADGRRAFRWTPEGGIVELAGLVVGTSDAYAVDPTGEVVVGESAAPNNSSVATLWGSDGVPVRLGDLPGGGRQSEARAISADGSAVVGRGRSASGDEAFYWSEALGMFSLGDFPGGGVDSFAYVVSGDGQIVAGRGTDPEGDVAFIWDQALGLQSLQSRLINAGLGDQLDGWRLEAVRGMTPDGLTFVGDGIDPDGNQQAWIATIPEPSSMVCLMVLALSLASSRSTTVS